MENAINIINYLKAGFPAISIKTDEPERIGIELLPVLKEANFNIMDWDIIKANDPMAAIAGLLEAKDNSVMLAFNFHWFLNKPQIIQLLINSFPEFSAMGKCFIVISNQVQLPKEIEKDFLLMNLELPGESAIGKSIDFITNGMPETVVKDRAKIIDMAKGLTKREMENVFALSLVEKKEIDPAIISQFKSQTIEKSGFLSVLKSDKTFDDVVGYAVVKSFIMSTINSPDAKGIILVGPPGCGKTSLAEAIMAQTGKFGLQVNMGKLFSKFVGETDKNIDYAIELIKSIGNCLVLIDEMEKAFSGAGSTGEGDSGVTRRALSRWLDFLQNRPKGIYVVATCNSFKGMPPEYLRPGRWDTSPFYMDLPNHEVRQQILTHYAEKKNVKVEDQKLNLENFSGAELEALVNVSAMMQQSLSESMKFIIPIAQTMPQEINDLRNWASKCCIPADVEQSKTLTRRLKVELGEAIPAFPKKSKTKN